jgi:hypothetical protein
MSPMRTVVRTLVVGTVAGLAACSDSPPTDPLGPETAPVQQVSPSDLDGLAKAIPGFGGLYLDENGAPTVYLTNPGQRGRAERVLAAFTREQGLEPGRLQVRQGAFAYQDLNRWYEASWRDVMAMPGTVFSDLDEANNRLLFGVENAAAVHGVSQALAARGIPAGAFEVRVVPAIHQAATLRDRFRPTMGGIQIHFGQYVCTLGFNANDGAEVSFITNSHCTNMQGGVESTSYYQPASSVDGTVIATEVEDPLYFKGGICPKGKKCRYSDSSRALYANPANSLLGGIGQTSGANNGSLTVTGQFSIGGKDASTSNFPVGTVVNKVGRTTGWTQGRVTNSCVNTSVSGSQVMQLCQTFVQDANGAVVVGGGDSGSQVFTGTSSVTLVGLLWGGSSDNRTFVFSPLKQVEQELGTLIVR